jgi:hypothetical protein
MATLPSKHTSPTQRTQRADPAMAPGGSLWWLWLVSDQAMIGAAKRPSQPAAPQPGADVARSWELADLALRQVEGQ